MRMGLMTGFALAIAAAAGTAHAQDRPAEDPSIVVCAARRAFRPRRRASSFGRL